MKLTKEELILGIAHCEEIETATTNEQHPCYDIFIAELEKLVSNAIKFEIIKTDDNIDIKPL